MLSKLYPELIDAEFGYFVPQQCPIDSKKHLNSIFSIFSNNRDLRVTEVDHLKYKYLLSVDGNSATGTRIPWVMFSNSVLLKQDSNKIEWFYSAIKPYIHYVPVNHELTDLFSQIQWMKDHDHEIQQISNTAHDFVKNNLMSEHIDAHVAIILNEYAKIQVDQKIKPTLPIADDLMIILTIIKKQGSYLNSKFIEWKKSVLSHL